MRCTTGSTQALTLRCLVSAMEQTTSADKSAQGKLQAGEISTEVFAVILDLCNSDTITTQKSALQLASIVVSGAAGDLLTFAQVEAAAQEVAKRIAASKESSGKCCAFFKHIVKHNLIVISKMMFLAMVGKG
jgi:hypothetical protein